MKIGLFGGTFDPVHIGHLIVAETVRSDYGLDRVVLVPAFQQPLKAEHPVADPRSRMEMADLAVEGYSGLAVSDMEIQRGDISYTIDTLRSFQQSERENVYYLIVGMDSLMDMPNWKQSESLIEEAVILVAARPGYDDSQVESWVKVKSVMVKTPLIDICSSEIRNRIRSRHSIRFWVPEKVEQYINRKGLYR